MQLKAKHHCLTVVYMTGCLINEAMLAAEEENGRRVKKSKIVDLAKK